MDVESIPIDYVPFRKVILCGNVLDNVRYIFQIGNRIPFLVSNDNPPRIWLDLLSNGKWVSFVSGNQVLESSGRSIIAGNKISISRGLHSVLHIKKVGSEACDISQLDFRPLGLSIKGDDKGGLDVGGMQLIRNTFRNVDTMVVISGSPPP